MYTNITKNKNVFSKHLKESLLMARLLRLSGNQFHIAGPTTVTTSYKLQVTKNIKNINNGQK